MSVIITNVSAHDGSIGISDYIVRINDEPVIARFEHWRHEGLATCLRKAADAVEASGHPNPFAKVEKWPHGCLKPGSCSRHLSCMYANCVHEGRDIGGDVKDALRSLEAQEGSGKQ